MYYGHTHTQIEYYGQSIRDSSQMSLLQMSFPHVIVHSTYCDKCQMSIVPIVQCVNRGIFSNNNVLYDDSEA